MSLTPTEYAQKLEKQINEILTVNRPFALGVASAHAAMTLRIFTAGEDVNNSQIGQYSKKGLYINPDKAVIRNQSGFTNKGKTGKSKFEDGREHVSTYFEGWKGFREAQGLETGKVNLNYVGELKSDFERPAKKIDVNQYEVSLDKEIDNLKARGNEAHFNKVIFTPSQKEIQKLIETTEKELRLLLS